MLSSGNTMASNSMTAPLSPVAMAPRSKGATETARTMGVPLSADLLPGRQGAFITDDALLAQCQRVALLYAVRQARKRHQPTAHLWQRLRDITARCL